MKKKEHISDVDEKTPSRAEYFSWINSTNEGSTEEQTLINLDFFAYLKRQFGMQLDIYAWDAGNLDGAAGTYETFDGEKLKKQYPNGYQPCVEKALESGIRLGVWGGADGYGDTPEQEQARRSLLVSLCQEFHFALFKFDRVCGNLRIRKRKAFIRTMQECRRYSPDLIVLNHRNRLGKAQKYVTTFLWQGSETYVDVLMKNNMTAPHHRASAFSRGMVPKLQRLTEDHGVCISSCIDYFEDEMILQAFGRSLILAPETYGNPWFMRDDEIPLYTRIHILHRKYRDILVNGMLLPSEYGQNTVSRGDDKRRFLCFSNPTWTTKKISVHLNEEIGLKPLKKISVINRFPYEGLVGIYPWNSVVEIEVLPFRAALVEVVDTREADMVLAGCLYTVTESNELGEPIRVNVVETDGKIVKQKKETQYPISIERRFDVTEKAPLLLGEMEICPVPAIDRKLYETAMYAISNDSFERQSVLRSGDTAIPEVKAARDAFFGQKTYRYRGCDSSVVFDGKDDTFFDARSKTYRKGFRVEGGCLRVDIGDCLYLDELVITYLEGDDNKTGSTCQQKYHDKAVFSSDLDTWHVSEDPLHMIEKDVMIPVVIEKTHSIVEVAGKLKKVRYSIGEKMRYFELPFPMDRIVSVYGEAEGEKVPFRNPKVNNLMAPYAKKITKVCKKFSFIIKKNAQNTFLAVAFEGKHENEGVYCVAECDGRYFGFEDRSCSYPCNIWEHSYAKSDSFYTYYMKMPDELLGRKMTVYALFNKTKGNIPVKVYLCNQHLQTKGLEIDVRLD